MGYSERVCQLCGVSFNIGRIRKAGEPEEAAWLGSGGEFAVSCEWPYDCLPGCSDGTRIRDNGDEKEHIAGPRCCNANGYSGWRIGVEEMKERLWALALAPKADGWQSEADDEDFEIASQRCFVTGLSKDGPDEFDLGNMQPARHGVSGMMILNADFDDDIDQAVPMHLACFEMFKRMSLSRFGLVDLDGFWNLRRTEDNPGEMYDGHKFPRSPDLEVVNEQWYNCEPGTEYLASTPLDVPDLQALLTECTGSSTDVVFGLPRRSEREMDPFDKLSPELKLLILLQLETKDVATLRLASKAFYQIPETYFRHAVLYEMPWVWEARDLQGKQIDWYKLWMRLAQSDGADCLDTYARALEFQCRYGDLGKRVSDEMEAKGIAHDRPEYGEEKKKVIMGLFGEREKSSQLETDGVKWLQRKPLTEIRGLRNRRRIYKDIEEILRRIEKLSPELRQIRQGTD